MATGRDSAQTVRADLGALTCPVYIPGQSHSTASTQFRLPNFPHMAWVNPWYGFQALPNSAAHRTDTQGRINHEITFMKNRPCWGSNRGPRGLQLVA